jgi:aminoglycoside phosphotransferase (APT) family kinase protein
LQVEPLLGGLRNTNFRIQIDTSPDWLVVRLYEHDASLCQKELDLFRFVARSVPVPSVLYAEPEGFDDVPPFAVLQFVEGITFQDLKHRGDFVALAEGAFSVGGILAAIHRFTFPKPGWLAPGLSVTPQILEGANPIPRFVDQCLASANLRRRMREEQRDRTHAMVWSRASQLASIEHEAHLVHGDFGKRNLLMRPERGQWSISAVLDWEFAVSGSPLIDLGHFLRYERHSHPLLEPHFSRGYLQSGGTLPHDWRPLARLADLVALCGSLTHDQLPDPVVGELLELINATVENRDHQLS